MVTPLAISKMVINFPSSYKALVYYIQHYQTCRIQSEYTHNSFNHSILIAQVPQMIDAKIFLAITISIYLVLGNNSICC